MQYDNRHDSGTGQSRITPLTAALQKHENKIKVDRHFGKVKIVPSTCKYTVTIDRFACRYTVTTIKLVSDKRINYSVKTDLCFYVAWRQNVHSM